MSAIPATQVAPPYFGSRVAYTIPGAMPAALPPAGISLTGGRTAHTIPAANLPDWHRQTTHAARAARNWAYMGPEPAPSRGGLYTQRAPLSTPALQLGVAHVAPRNQRNDIGRYVGRGPAGPMNSSQRLPEALVLHTKPVQPRFQM